MSELEKERHPKRSDLLEKAKALSSTPGVYLMKHETGQVLYVGKAKSLKNRVTSYFQPILHETARIEIMVSLVSAFDVILTETEEEALVLECTLIKKYRPKYNIRLKDDKHYPYIKISESDPYPRLEWTRKVLNDQARYFGPFPSGWSARVVLKLLTESYRLRDCADNTFAHRSRPCLLYQMDQCSGPCVGKISQEDYKNDVESAIKVLEGRGKDLLKNLKQSMKIASDEERFEDAARFRDQIQSIEVITQTQSVSDPNQRIDQDVFAFDRKEARATGVVLQVRHGKLISVRHYRLENVDMGQTDHSILRDFLAQHFLLSQPADDSVIKAPVVLMREAPEDLQILESTLGIRVKTPKTPHEKQLVNVAQTNAKHSLEKESGEHAGHGFHALEEVAQKLNLERIPRRMECFDISNFQGEEIVASRVVFLDGSPDKNLYRRYKIKTVRQANDFASMREVLDRRFSKMNLQAGDERPDLILVDGGKGQLAQAVAILDDLNIQGVAVAGIAKARTESDFQAPEVQSSLERVFLPNRVNPVLLYPHTRAYKILTHLRDEAHRFAITYHRQLRDKKSIHGK